jgi:hypothetical protein
MNTLVRAHDQELTRSANDYEEKIAGLFNHSAIGKMVIAESGYFKGTYMYTYVYIYMYIYVCIYIYIYIYIEDDQGTSDSVAINHTPICI